MVMFVLESHHTSSIADRTWAAERCGPSFLKNLQDNSIPGELRSQVGEGEGAGPHQESWLMAERLCGESENHTWECSGLHPMTSLTVVVGSQGAVVFKP